MTFSLFNIDKITTTAMANNCLEFLSLERTRVTKMESEQPTRSMQGIAARNKIIDILDTTESAVRTRMRELKNNN